MISLIAKAVNSNPPQKQKQLIKLERLIFFSTNFPPKAADIPKKKMAKEKAQPVPKVLVPICIAIASLKVLQQYTVPMEQWIKSAGIAALIHLLFILHSPLFHTISCDHDI